MGCLVLLVAGRASADPIVVGITGGFLDMGPDDGPLVLSGDHGFTFSSHVDIAGGVFMPSEECFNGCLAGSSLNLLGSWLGNDLVGNATLDGVTYLAVGSTDTTSMGVAFNGMATLPPIADSATVVAPFTFSGEFDHPGPGGIAETDTLEGLGTATLTLVRDGSRTDSWLLSEARYDLAPTPEPASLLLVITGLAATVLRCRTRQPRRQAC
jgi:subtilisin family serine protease